MCIRDSIKIGVKVEFPQAKLRINLFLKNLRITTIDVILNFIRDEKIVYEIFNIFFAEKCINYYSTRIILLYKIIIYIKYFYDTRVKLYITTKP